MPVEADGSANFLVPADRNLYLQALDERLVAIQTERTYVNYRPGETRSCVGCHDYARAGDAGQAPTVSLALKRPPSVPAPQPGEASAGRVIDYERQIQPIWDARCVRCHDGGEKAAGHLKLTGERTALYCVSYESLLNFGAGKDKDRMPLVGQQVDENDVRAFVAYAPPYFFGAASSVLAAVFGGTEPHYGAFGDRADALAARTARLRERHRDVTLTADEFLRLANWLDASCQYYPSYWGQKNLQHQGSPYFRPAVTCEEALGARWPESLRGLYEPPASALTAAR